MVLFLQDFVARAGKNEMAAGQQLQASNLRPATSGQQLQAEVLDRRSRDDLVAPGCDKQKRLA